MNLPEPVTDQEIYRDFPYRDLIQIREQLMNDIRAFESDKEPWNRYIQISEANSPYEEYAINLMRLAEVSLMILKAYPKELESQNTSEEEADGT